MNQQQATLRTVELLYREGPRMHGGTSVNTTFDNGAWAMRFKVDDKRTWRCGVVLSNTADYDPEEHDLRALLTLLTPTFSTKASYLNRNDTDVDVTRAVSVLRSQDFRIAKGYYQAVVVPECGDGHMVIKTDTEVRVMHGVIGEEIYKRTGDRIFRMPPEWDTTAALVIENDIHSVRVLESTVYPNHTVTMWADLLFLSYIACHVGGSELLESAAHTFRIERKLLEV